MGNINRNSEMEEMNMESETDMKNNSLKVCEDYLKKEISNEMPLESIVNVFEKIPKTIVETTAITISIRLLHHVPST